MIFEPKVSILPWDRTVRDWKARSIGNAEVGGGLGPVIKLDICSENMFS
jgi:hypothetical protein